MKNKTILLIWGIVVVCIMLLVIQINVEDNKEAIENNIAAHREVLEVTEMLIQELELTNETIDRLSKRVTQYKLDTPNSLIIDGMTIQLDPISNSIKIMNLDGNIEMYCEQLMYNGKEVIIYELNE